MRASWGPSSLQCPETRSPVHPMNSSEIDEVVAGFATSARHAADGGIDGIEVHAAHGYLITAFMSSYSNERTDEYGGSFGNRMRFALEVMTAVERALPAGVALGVRVSAEEMVARGMDLDQTCAALAYLRERVRIDYISVSHGNYTSHENVVPDHTFSPAFNAGAGRPDSGRGQRDPGSFSPAASAPETSPPPWSATGRRTWSEWCGDTSRTRNGRARCSAATRRARASTATRTAGPTSARDLRSRAR